ncbi:hypothetical protein GpartN1_g6185.t1 [Galdieria partita]|uniref:C3H1-type domain-containing protein n=1 Tax=Galdieria partita TaxID=83374 RepID=A0A9C7USP8_9RHOD|nr:hypothetical protein GpartN1_g6185.t1 [Galdieria partita]
MNVTAVLPEVVQQRGKEELLEHCTPTGDNQKSDKRNPKNFSQVFHRCGELELGRMSEQPHFESTKSSDVGKPPLRMDCTKRSTGGQDRVGAATTEASGEQSKAAFSPLHRKLGLSFGERRECFSENKVESPFRSTLLDTSTLTEDLRNMDLSSSEEESEESEMRKALHSGRRSFEMKRADKDDREAQVDKAEPESWNSPYTGDKITKKNIVQSSSYPLFAIRPYHFDTKDLSTKELEDTIRHSLSEANRQSVSPPSTETYSLVNHSSPSQAMKASDSFEILPPYALQRSSSSSFPYNTNNSVPPAPWMTRWKTRMCKFYPMGMCKNGSKCSFAHSAEELREPESFCHSNSTNAAVQASGNLSFYDMESSYLRSQKLDLYNSGGYSVSSASFSNRSFVPGRPESVSGHSFQSVNSSTDENVSPSASVHGNNQGKSVPPAPWMTHFKTKMCKFFSAGECKNGDKCSFAHSMEELRDPPPPEVNEERRRRYLKRQLQQLGMLNEQNNKFLSFSGDYEHPSSHSMHDSYANANYLRMREQLSGKSYESYYRDVPKLLSEQSQASGVFSSPKKNLMYSLSSPQLGGSLDVSSNIHRSSSYSFLELNSEMFGSDLTNYPGQSAFQYYGDSNVAHSTGMPPESSYVGAYKDSLSRSMDTRSPSNVRSVPGTLSKALNYTKVADSLCPMSSGKRKDLIQAEIEMNADRGLPNVNNTPRAVQQEEIWDEIDRDILHVVFDEDMESKNN